MSADLVALLRIVADGREQYAHTAPDGQRTALFAEAAAFRSAALLAEGEPHLDVLLPKGVTPDVEALAARVIAQARPAEPEPVRPCAPVLPPLTPPRWEHVSAGIVCPACQHRRAAHQSVTGGDCQGTREPDGALCGCDGPPEDAR